MPSQDSPGTGYKSPDEVPQELLAFAENIRATHESLGATPALDLDGKKFDLLTTYLELPLDALLQGYMIGGIDEHLASLFLINEMIGGRDMRGDFGPIAYLAIERKREQIKEVVRDTGSSTLIKGAFCGFVLASGNHKFSEVLAQIPEDLFANPVFSNTLIAFGLAADLKLGAEALFSAMRMKETSQPSAFRDLLRDSSKRGANPLNSEMMGGILLVGMSSECDLALSAIEKNEIRSARPSLERFLSREGITPSQTLTAGRLLLRFSSGPLLRSLNEKIVESCCTGMLATTRGSTEWWRLNLLRYLAGDESRATSLQRFFASSPKVTLEHCGDLEEYLQQSSRRSEGSSIAERLVGWARLALGRFAPEDRDHCAGLMDALASANPTVAAPLLMDWYGSSDLLGPRGLGVVLKHMERMGGDQVVSGMPTPEEYAITMLQDGEISASSKVAIVESLNMVGKAIYLVPHLFGSTGERFPVASALRRIVDTPTKMELFLHELSNAGSIGQMRGELLLKYADSIEQGIAIRIRDPFRFDPATHVLIVENRMRASELNLADVSVVVWPGNDICGAVIHNDSDITRIMHECGEPLLYFELNSRIEFQEMLAELASYGTDYRRLVKDLHSNTGLMVYRDEDRRTLPRDAILYGDASDHKLLSDAASGLRFEEIFLRGCNIADAGNETLLRFFHGLFPATGADRIVAPRRSLLSRQTWVSKDTEGRSRIVLGNDGDFVTVAGLESSQATQSA